MKKTLLPLLPAVGVVVLYLLLAGNDQIAGLRKANARVRELGTVEEHEQRVFQLQRELAQAQTELDALRAAPADSALSVRPARNHSEALREAHRRISNHDGARILGVFRSEDASGGAASAGSGLDALLKDLGGDSVRRWSVSLEAPWAAARAILDDFAATTNGAPVVVQSLSMQPGVGNGRPACWSMTICQ